MAISSLYMHKIAKKIKLKFTNTSEIC